MADGADSAPPDGDPPPAPLGASQMVAGARTVSVGYRIGTARQLSVQVTVSVTVTHTVWETAQEGVDGVDIC